MDQRVSVHGYKYHFSFDFYFRKNIYMCMYILIHNHVVQLPLHLLSSKIHHCSGSTCSFPKRNQKKWNKKHFRTTELSKFSSHCWHHVPALWIIVNTLPPPPPRKKKKVPTAWVLESRIRMAQVLLFRIFDHGGYKSICINIRFVVN